MSPVKRQYLTQELNDNVQQLIADIGELNQTAQKMSRLDMTRDTFNDYFCEFMRMFDRFADCKHACNNAFGSLLELHTDHGTREVGMPDVDKRCQISAAAN